MSCKYWPGAAAMLPHHSSKGEFCLDGQLTPLRFAVQMQRRRRGARETSCFVVVLSGTVFKFSALCVTAVAQPDAVLCFKRRTWTTRRLA